MTHIHKRAHRERERKTKRERDRERVTLRENLKKLIKASLFQFIAKKLNLCLKAHVFKKTK